MACVRPGGIKYAMFVNPFATNAAKTAPIHGWWYEDIARINQAQSTSDPPHAYISVVNESSQWLCLSLTLCIRLSHRFVPPVQQWYGIPLQDFNWDYWWILNKAASRAPENGGLGSGQGEVYIPHKHSWGKFKVPFLFYHCLDIRLCSASFDLQRPKMWILFTEHTSMAYDEWEWTIDHWLIISTRHSLPSLEPPSTIDCRPGNPASLPSRQSLVQEVEHNASAKQEILITLWRMHAQMYFVVSMRIFILPRQRFKPTRWTISTGWFAEGSTPLVQTEWWYNLTMIWTPVLRTSMILSRRSW